MIRASFGDVRRARGRGCSGLGTEVKGLLILRQFDQVITALGAGNPVYLVARKAVGAGNRSLASDRTGAVDLGISAVVELKRVAREHNRGAVMATRIIYALGLPGAIPLFY